MDFQLMLLGALGLGRLMTMSFGTVQHVFRYILLGNKSLKDYSRVRVLFFFRMVEEKARNLFVDLSSILPITRHKREPSASRFRLDKALHSTIEIAFRKAL